MKKIIKHTLIWIVCISPLMAAVPKIEDLKPNERVSITLMYSEPAVNEYIYVFAGRAVTISQNGKLHGRLVITDEDAERIDEHLFAVQKAKKASKNLLGAPVYTIKHENSGKTIETWTYRISKTKESRKPVLSLGELKKRIPE